MSRKIVCFIFSRMVEPEQCPDCGKYTVRKANEAEKLEYAKNLREFGDSDGQAAAA